MKSIQNRIVACVLVALVAGCSTGPYRGVSNPEIEGAAAKGSHFVGSRAPVFSLENDQGNPVSLDSLKGKWAVVYFYPQDDTPGCTCQANEFTELLSQFSNMNAVVLGVSPNTPASHRLFREKYDLHIVLLSDTSHETMRQYGAWMDMSIEGKDIGRVIRTTFIIDPNGKIAWHWPEVIPKGHAERVRDKLAELSGHS